ncbi:MAG: hypothetical protein KA206_07940 [Paludibacter sp.]|nr:hypothetical protein [Paludibacter sp.]
MAKLNQGILGGFTGTVGTVIGMCKKNGDDVIIAKSKRKRTSNTEGQVNQRTKFGLATGFMQTLNPLVKVGCKVVAGNDMSPYNYACKHLMAKAIVGTAPDFEIDYSQVLISNGQLSQPTNASAQLVNGVVNFKWDDNTGDCRGAGTDKAVLIVYNVSNLELSYNSSTATRSSKAGTLNIPNSSEGDQLVFYMYLQSATDPYTVTSSQYLGTATV